MRNHGIEIVGKVVLYVGLLALAATILLNEIGMLQGMFDSLGMDHGRSSEFSLLSKQGLGVLAFAAVAGALIWKFGSRD